MLSTSERDRIMAEAGDLPDRRAAVSEALMIVQESRGWVSDEAVADIALALDLSREEIEGVATFFELDVPQAGRSPCHHGLRQRELLDQGRRLDRRLPEQEAGRRLRRDDARRDVHAPARGLSRRMRAGADDDRRRRFRTETSTSDKIDEILDRLQRGQAWRLR